MEPRLVRCQWLDAYGDKTDEVTLEDVEAGHQPIKVETIGWLLVDNEIGVSIFNERYEGKYRGRTFILRSMVQGIEDVVKPRKKRMSKLDSHHDDSVKALG